MAGPYDPAIDARLRGAADALDPRPEPVVRAERVGEAAQDVLARLETLQHELDRLLGGLRGTADTLSRRPDDDASPGR
jgi:hypothetical protein